MKQCDRCTNEARYMRHDLDNGEVLQLCPSCAGGPVPDATTTTYPPQCQLCDLEPTQIVLTTPEDGESLALGEFCHHVMMRTRWQQLDDGVRETLQEQVEDALHPERLQERIAAGEAAEQAATAEQPAPDSESEAEELSDDDDQEQPDESQPEPATATS